MAAPTFVGAGTGTVQTAAGDALFGKGDVFGGTATTIGNIVVVQVLQDALGTAPTIGSIANPNVVENLAGTNDTMTFIGAFDVGSAAAAKQHLWIGRCLSNVYCSIDINTTGDDIYCRMYEFATVNTGTAITDVIENSTAGSTANSAGTSTTIADAGVTTLGADRLAVNFVAVNDDNVVGAMTGMTGGTWAEAVAEYATATGTDGCIQLQTAAMASAGTINGGTYVMVISDAWGALGFALIGTTSAAAPSLVLPSFRSTSTLYNL